MGVACVCQHIGVAYIFVGVACLCPCVNMQKLLVKESTIVSLNEEVKKLNAENKETDRGQYRVSLQCCQWPAS